MKEALEGVRVAPSLRWVMKEKRVPVSTKLQDRWRALRSALNVAAEPFTGSPAFSMSPQEAYNLIGASEEATKILMESPPTPPDLHHKYAISSDGRLEHVVSWRVTGSSS